MARLQVGVVGGSIAGCTAAAELIRTGAEATAFERLRGEMKGRGAGIAVPPPTDTRTLRFGRQGKGHLLAGDMSILKRRASCGIIEREHKF